MNSKFSNSIQFYFIYVLHGVPTFFWIQDGKYLWREDVQTDLHDPPISIIISMQFLTTVKLNKTAKMSLSFNIAATATQMERFLKEATQTVLFLQPLHNLNFWSYDYCFVVSSAHQTITVGAWQLENISGGCQEVHSGVHHIEIGGLWVCLCVFVCYTKAVLSIEGWWWDQAASPCYRRHNQVGPGGFWLSWPHNTQRCSMGRKL